MKKHTGSPGSIPHEFSSARLGVNPVRFSAGSVPTSSGEVGSGTVRFKAGSVLGRFTGAWCETGSVLGRFGSG